MFSGTLDNRHLNPSPLESAIIFLQNSPKSSLSKLLKVIGLHDSFLFMKVLIKTNTKTPSKNKFCCIHTVNLGIALNFLFY